MKDRNVFEAAAQRSLLDQGKHILNLRGQSWFENLSYPIHFQGETPKGDWETFFEAQTLEDVEFKLQNYGLGNDYVAMRAVCDNGRIFHHTMEEIVYVESRAEQKATRQLVPLGEFINSSPIDCVKTATEIMQAAEASQHFTIPNRAVVLVNHPALHRIMFVEFDDSVACRLYITPEQTESEITVTIWKWNHPRIQEHRNEFDLPDNFPPFAMSPKGIPAPVGSFLFLLCASIVRDFWVLNRIDRQRIYKQNTEKVRRRVGKGKDRKLETRKNYTFIPRFKYNIDAYNTKSKTAVKHSVRVTLSPSLVSGHIRKLPEGWNTSDEARENATEFGITRLAPGTTFVRPHKRGEIEQLRNYRSHSALQLLFETGDNDETQANENRNQKP